MVHDTVVEPYVEAIFWQELPRALRRGGTGIRRLEAELARREEELAAYRDNPRLPKTLGASRFADGLGVRVRRVEESRRALAHARIEGDRKYLAEPDALARRWTDMSVNERRNAIAAVLDCVFVSQRLHRRQPFEERVHVYLRGRGPGPVTYEKGGQTIAFNPASLPAGVTLRPPKGEVDTQALRQELETFLHGRTFWPPFRHFQAHGRAELYSRVRRTGGVRRWAADLGLECRPPNFITGTWSEERIRAELRPFLEGRAEWPSGREFSAAGLHALREALRWYGGADRWAREMGVTLPWPRKTVRRWSYEEMREKVRAVAGDQGLWPTRKQFAEAGLGSLDYATQRRPDLAEQLCADLELLPRRKRTNHPRRWTDENIEAALDQLLKGRDTWPGADGFADAGLRGLREQLRRRGIMGEWAQRCGFEPPRWGRVGRRLKTQRSPRRYVQPALRAPAAAGLQELLA
jgi:hypothetical protein